MHCTLLDQSEGVITSVHLKRIKLRPKGEIKAVILYFTNGLGLHFKAHFRMFSHLVDIRGLREVLMN